MLRSTLFQWIWLMKVEKEVQWSLSLPCVWWFFWSWPRGVTTAMWDRMDTYQDHVDARAPCLHNFENGIFNLLLESVTQHLRFCPHGGIWPSEFSVSAKFTMRNSRKQLGGKHMCEILEHYSVLVFFMAVSLCQIVSILETMHDFLM